MRTIGSKTTKKEVAFKVKKETHPKQQQEEESDSEDELDDENIEAMFVRRLKRGS
ncbi:hypothetical protein KI387_016398, partial [Taxus chinensis]